MKISHTIFFSCFLFLQSCGQAQNGTKQATEGDHKFTNHLIHESSPYLLQHAHNPVNWYPWGQEALDKAKKENKLLLISIGYAACHWCHVMEHESFENEEVARFMNDHFVSIKVDREERPDVDQIYMNAVQLVTGSGGWPLNCIAMPDGRPIYGGTYFPSDQWIDMLTKVLDFVEKNPGKAEEQATALSEGVRSGEMISLNTRKPEFSTDDLKDVFNTWKSNIDFAEGGQKKAPKFPMPVGYQFLLQYYDQTKNPDALKAVTLTLDKVADGGIYDQIGGGFSRYSTDAYWKVPHFEKMLYDNAQLVSLYAAAFQETKDPAYQTIVSESLEFIRRELSAPAGGFYASLDADSEGEEGKYYFWSKAELQKVLGNKADLIIEYYNVTESGNWENGHNILYKRRSDKLTADKYHITEIELKSRVTEAKSILLQERSKRIRPRLDDKIITSWNALMLTAYVKAYQVFGDRQYLDVALQNAEFLHTKVKSANNRLTRNYKDGKASINGFLDDYAFTITAFITLYQATFDEKWIHEAKQLADYAVAHFYDNKSGMFFYTSDVDPGLIARKMEVSDNVIPASNSEMAKNLFVLGQYYYNEDFILKAKQMLNNVKQNTKQGGSYYANWDILMDWFVNPPYEVAIVGGDVEARRKEFDQYYLPGVFLSGGKTEGTMPLLEGKFIEGQTTIYVCQNKACKLPVTDVKEALKQIRNKL